MRPGWRRWFGRGRSCSSPARSRRTSVCTTNGSALFRPFAKRLAAAQAVLSQLKTCIRANYSNPPAHGAAIVAAILSDPQLRGLWEGEVRQIRERINGMRSLFVRTLAERGVGRDFSFITRQRGMFSFSGLTPEQVRRSAGRTCDLHRRLRTDQRGRHDGRKHGPALLGHRGRAWDESKVPGPTSKVEDSRSECPAFRPWALDLGHRTFLACGLFSCPKTFSATSATNTT